MDKIPNLMGEWSQSKSLWRTEVLLFVERRGSPIPLGMRKPGDVAREILAIHELTNSVFKPNHLLFLGGSGG